MKKHISILILLFCAIFISSFTEKTNVDTINYYEKNQKKSLNELIAETYKESKIPILYFYADWCPPCRSFKKSLTDKKVQKSLSNARLIKIDIDVDTDEVALKYSVNAIPTYIKVTNEGKILAKINSGEWEEDIPKNIAPVLRKLVNSTKYDIK